MVRINLLPWREQARQIKKKNFFAMLGVAVGITLFIILLFHLYYADLLAYQKHRNDFLQAQISEKQLVLNELRKEKEHQDVIQTKIQFLIDLRENSYRAIRLLNELLRIVPDTITLNKIRREDNAITIEGKAQAELSITAFLKSMSQSAIFNQPVLTGINTAPSAEKTPERFFQVKVEQKK